MDRPSLQALILSGLPQGNNSTPKPRIPVNVSRKHTAVTRQHAASETQNPQPCRSSHGNSSKDFRRQPVVARDVAQQLAAGSQSIMGVMIESNLVEDRQSFKPGAELSYGQSITDACLGWDDTVSVLEELAAAVKAKRAARP